MSIVSKAIAAYRDGGFQTLQYRARRKALSLLVIFTLDVPERKFRVKNGVAVRDSPLLYPDDVDREHESELIHGIRHAVNPSDTVIVIGGGTGPSTVVAARYAGPDGQVTVYEGSKRHVDICRETMEVNCVGDRVDVVHGIVETGIHLLDDPSEAASVSAADLEDCDVLVMDCEGAELPIINALEIRPQHIVVETHAHFDSPEEIVREALADMDYSIVHTDRRSNNISILQAHRDG